MQFEPFTSRRITISKANKKELESYKKQLEIYRVSSGLNISNTKNNSYYLKVEDISKKLIGIIQVDEIAENIANVDVSIPNEVWRFRYGTEVIHQFVRCCQERKLYKTIKLEQNCISIKYRIERQKMFKNSEKMYIEIN